MFFNVLHLVVALVLFSCIINKRVVDYYVLKHRKWNEFMNKKNGPNSEDQRNIYLVNEVKKQQKTSSSKRLKILLLMLAVSICLLGITSWQSNGQNTNFIFGRSSVSVSFSGRGTESNPYIIETVDDLASLSEMVNGGTNFKGVHFRLENDIDLTDFLSPRGSGYNSGAGWRQIGRNMHQPFSGVFDGAGHTVSGLWINRTSEPHIGLFGYIMNAEIKNLNVEVAQGRSIAGGVSTGILVGLSYESVITNSSASGTVRVDTNRDIVGVGGIVGNMYWGYVVNCETDVYIYAVATSGISQLSVGGLVGKLSHNASISNSIARGNIAATGYDSRAGGLVGTQIASSISDSRAYGNVSAYATGSYTSDSVVMSGGLVGFMARGRDNSNIVVHSQAMGDVSANGDAIVEAGGLVGGVKAGDIINSYAVGNVSATGHSPVAGGLVGSQYSGTIINCKAYGNVSARVTGEDVNSAALSGGLVGFMVSLDDITGSAIIYSSASGNVSVYGDFAVGMAGGLVGAADTGNISNSYATGNVFTTGDIEANLGGLVGIGDLGVVIENCYAIGRVLTEGSRSITAGLAGAFWGDMTNSFFDINATGQRLGNGDAESLSASNDLTMWVTSGMYTSEMMRMETFIGWDFDGVWGIVEGQTYPFLLSENIRGVRR